MTTSTLSRPAVLPTSHRIWSASLWIVQVGLAFLFGAAGLMKATTPIATLAQSLPYTAEIPEALVRFIGLSEVAGAIGLILPSLFRVKPALTPLAAAALALVMVLASAFHLSRGEAEALPINLVLGALSAFVVWGRLEKAPIAARR